MSSGSSGLESIAIAAARIDADKKEDESMSSPMNLSSLATTSPDIPFARGFGAATRVVSADYGSDRTATPPSVHGSGSVPSMPYPRGFQVFSHSSLASNNSHEHHHHNPIGATVVLEESSSPHHAPPSCHHHQAQQGQSSLQCAQNAMDDLMKYMGLKETSTTEPKQPPSGPIEAVLENDVLSGRGGKSNHHNGNLFYRNLVKACQPAYITAKRREKPRIAECIVFTVRKLGGRFLKLDPSNSNAFIDVGNTKAREKTSQALREGAPEMRGDNKEHPDEAAEALRLGGTNVNSQFEQQQQQLVGCKRRVSCPELVTPPPHPVQQQQAPSYPTIFESPLFAHTNKKMRRTSLEALAAIACVAIPTAASTATTTMHMSSPPVLVASPSSSDSYSSSTSAEDEGVDAAATMLRGPRIKLLKHRLRTEGR